MVLRSVYTQTFTITLPCTGEPPIKDPLNKGQPPIVGTFLGTTIIFQPLNKGQPLYNGQTLFSRGSTDSKGE